MGYGLQFFSQQSAVRFLSLRWDLGASVNYWQFAFKHSQQITDMDHNQTWVLTFELPCIPAQLYLQGINQMMSKPFILLLRQNENRCELVCFSREFSPNQRGLTSDMAQTLLTSSLSPGRGKVVLFGGMEPHKEGNVIWPGERRAETGNEGEPAVTRTLHWHCSSWGVVSFIRRAMSIGKN